jgi:DNA-binding MarR family transcriptional regulator
MEQDNEQLMRNLAWVYMLLHRRIDRAMADQGASLARTKLMILIQKSGGAARAADIAEVFGQAPRTVTEALDGLERDGLIVRTPDAADRRVKRLAITEAGTRAISATEPVRRRLIDEVFDRLDGSERATLTTLLGKLLAGLPDPNGMLNDPSCR